MTSSNRTPGAADRGGFELPRTEGEASAMSATKETDLGARSYVKRLHLRRKESVWWKTTTYWVFVWSLGPSYPRDQDDSRESTLLQPNGPGRFRTFDAVGGGLDVLRQSKLGLLRPSGRIFRSE